jgi:hypothetical protein
VKLVESNRVPDWYFFDLKNIKKGDRIIIHGSTADSNHVFTIGAIAFDEIK